MHLHGVVLKAQGQLYFTLLYFTLLYFIFIMQVSPTFCCSLPCKRSYPPEHRSHKPPFSQQEEEPLVEKQHKGLWWQNPLD
jgi:hypothetical protein